MKVSAAGAAGLGALDWAVTAQSAYAATLTEGVDYKLYHSTCPYCSASCGQIVMVALQACTLQNGLAFAAGDVMDVYGDAMSPINQGGLCAKGAGAWQHATNKRRLGAFATNPVNPKFAYNASYPSGVAYKRLGNNDWDPMDLDDAMNEIALALKTARDGHRVPAYSNGYNSKGVAFLGCSHMNNEQNYTYRKLIAQFGTSNTEHQARI